MAVVRSFKGYDVFLNFRGEDTRKTFTHKLYMALVERGLSTFRDEDTMNKGENLKLELEIAISQSKSSIVVISKDYASSTWCLDELVLILEQRRTSRHAVLPVFYDVDPSHVRKQSGTIAEAFARYEEQFKAETDCRRKRELMKKIKGWRSALTEVGFLNGLDFQNHVNGHESKFIKQIIKIISDKLIQLTVVLKIKLHGEGCIRKIMRIISMINGVDKFTVDPRKDLVIVEGRMDVKELVFHLEEKIKRSVQLISVANKKDDKGAENKEQKLGDKSGDKKDKDKVGVKKEEETGGGDGKKETKIKYPNTHTIPVHHQSDKKEKESGGGDGKKENKMGYNGYYLDPNTMTVYYQSGKNEKESGGGVGKMVYYGLDYNKYTIPVYHQSDEKEKESDTGKRESKMGYHGYYPNTYTMPMYPQSYAASQSMNYFNPGYTMAYSHSPSGGQPSYYHHAMFNDGNPNWCSVPLHHQGDKKEKESGGGDGRKENKKEKESDSRSGGKRESKMEFRGYYPNTYMMPMNPQISNAALNLNYFDHGYTSEPTYYHPAMFSDVSENLNWCSIM